MKTYLILSLAVFCAVELRTARAQAPQENPPGAVSDNAVPAVKPAENNVPPPNATPAPNESAARTGATAEQGGPAEDTTGPQLLRNAAPNNTGRNNGSTNNPTAAGERNLRLNFRGVPLEMVLNYLSEAAGFIIVLETDVKGKMDVWSNQPLNRDEAVDLLNTILNQNGYSAIRNGRTLRIVSRDDAKKRDLPVTKGNDPQTIPKTDQMVTQIIPVRYANASQLTKDLEPLLPSYATLTANESGNALILTDTQSNVRRMAEIVRAVDTSLTNNTTIRVFPLQYADAKDLAASIKDLFQPPATQGQGNNNGGRNFFNRFFPGGGPGGGRGPGGGGGGNGGGGQPGAGSTSPNSKVAAVADERTNSLVVSAPEEIIPVIEQLVREIDVNSTDVTELRVFHLLNADPMEVADIFSQLFPDPSTSRNDQQNQFGFRFGGGPGGFRGNRGNRGNQTGQTSERETKKGRVSAVADARTQSLIVSAARELMPDIAAMIEQLDRSSTRKQRVYIYSLENADVQEVEQVVRDMFERNNITANRNTANQNSALQSRSQQLIQNNNSPARSNNGFGGSGNTGNGGTFR